MIHGKSVSGHSRTANIGTHSPCNNMHEAYAASSQIRSQNGEGNLGAKFHPLVSTLQWKTINQKYMGFTK